MPISAVLLAAGESTRMGQPKALLPWHGAMLLQHQVSSLLEAGAAEAVVVLGHRAESLRPLVEGLSSVSWVLNLRYRTGKTSSIRAGLRRIAPEAEGVLVLAVDQPRSPEVLARLLTEHQRHRSLITLPAYRGTGGHPPIFSASLLPELRRIRESRQGLREVMRRHADQVVRVEVDAPEVLWDLNAPEEYEMAVRETG